jgi:adenosylhomocysteine nucleosidase
MLALLGAFGQEIADLRRRMAIEEVVAERHCKLYRGKLGNKDALLVKTGMGKKRAESATTLILERYPVTAIISLGFAGGLAPELGIGDVVVCSTLYCDSAAEIYASDARLLALAAQVLEDIAGRVRFGSGVTALYVEASPQKMRELRETFSVDIVDNESYWIARIASASKIPFIAIRSISDDMQHSVQPFDRILSADGELLWKKAVLSFLSHPWYLMNVYNLFRNTRAAKRNMAAFIGQLAAKI